MTRREWWHTEPPAVQAVIDLANVEGCEHIAAVFAPQHLDTLTAIGDLLVRIDALESGDLDVLTDLIGERVSVIHADEVADEYATQARAEALTAAQLVASVLTIGAAA